MNYPVSKKEMIYTHVILDGTAYEVGRIQGEMLQSNAQYVQWLTSSTAGNVSREDADKMFKYFDRYCPGINEEVAGLADSLKVDPARIAYYTFSATLSGQCSHMAVLPGITQNRHVLVGRSYEWNDEDELRLCTTRIRGKAAHIGFSLMQLGRYDGFNEHGLGVTMSSGVPRSSPQVEGLKFWAVIRTILDNCKTVVDALDLIAEIPMSFNWNLILADKNGEAALVEIACQNRAIKKINDSTPDQFICATNHYTLPEMLAYDTNRMRQSVARYNAIQKGIKSCASNVRCEDIRQILTGRVPEGVCCHYYKDGLGTLWSMIFYITAGTVEICFGSPQANSWRKFDLSGEPGVRQYKAIMPCEDTPDPMTFYGRLKAGENI